MTSTSEHVTVTQADRDAAADMWERHAGKRFDFHRQIARGEHDDHYSVQALARHRTQSQPSSDALTGDVERDAARWRALWSSDRIRMIGTAGFDHADDGSVTLCEGVGHHMGLEVWDRHPAKNDGEGTRGRASLLAYVDHRAALSSPTQASVPHGDAPQPTDTREAVIEAAYRAGHQAGRCGGSLTSVDEDWEGDRAKIITASPTPPAVSLSGGGALERTARLLCDEPDARRIADQMDAPCFDESSAHVQEYWLTLAAALASTPPVLPEVDDGVTAVAREIADHFKTVEGSPSTGELDPPLSDADAVTIKVGTLRRLCAALDAPHTGEVLGG